MSGFDFHEKVLNFLEQTFLSKCSRVHNLHTLGEKVPYDDSTDWPSLSVSTEYRLF